MGFKSAFKGLIVNFDGNKFLSLPELNTCVYNTYILETECYYSNEAVIHIYHYVNKSLMLSVIKYNNPLFV